MRKTYTTHSTADPALTKMSAQEVIAYSKSRDAGDLGELDGKPTGYHFRRLTRSQRFYVDAATTEEERAERIFMAGIVSIDGGELREAWAPDGVGASGYLAMSVTEFESLLDEVYAPADVRDVAQVIYTRSILLPKAVPAYPPVRMSAHAWDAQQRPSVEPTPVESAQSNAERSAA